MHYVTELFVKRTLDFLLCAIGSGKRTISVCNAIGSGVLMTVVVSDSIVTCSRREELKNSGLTLLYTIILLPLVIV